MTDRQSRAWLDQEPRTRSLPALLAAASQTHPDREFLRFGTDIWTYGEITDRAARIAGGLVELGVQPGDRVLMMMSNRPEMIASWFACGWVGAVQVAVNTAYKGMLLEHIVENADPSIAIIAPEHIHLFDLKRRPYDRLRHVVILDDSAELSLDQLARSPRAEPHLAHHQDVHGILYSSGTTGPSKGILLSHNYYWYGGHRMAEHSQVTSQDRLYTCLPLFHANAQVLTVMTALVSGASVALDDRFSASRFWDTMRRTGATRFNYIGGMIPILLKQESTDLDRDHQVRFAAGAAAPEDLFEEFESRFGVRLMESYGQTENCVALSNPVAERRIGSVGLPNCGFDVEIVDDDDIPVSSGVVGELVFRPQVPDIMMSGYNAMPEAMLEASRNLWFHTGDLMRRDDDGYYYFVDRKKDAIRRRGENISAYEVELVVNSHAAVLESAAIAVPSEVGEDEVMVCVVLRPGADLDPVDLIAHCEERMPYFSVPRFVDFRDELPKTPTHRVEKYRLRTQGVTASTWDREAAGYQLAR